MKQITDSPIYSITINEDGSARVLFNNLNYAIVPKERVVVLTSEEDYRKLCERFIGETLKDFFCNGFFDYGREYDLEGAEIISIHQDTSQSILITVRKINGKYDYGRFDGGWGEWGQVYKYLQDWVDGEDDKT